MLEDNPLLSKIVSRFHIIVASLVALGGAAIFGIAAGSGDFFNIYIGLFVCGFIAIMLALGDKFWLVVPFAFTSQLPAIPIKGRLLELPEITAVLGTAVFLVRYAVKRQTLSIFRREHVPILLYTAWVVMVFCLNPVGLSDAGAALGGARFYAKILLALASFLIMANQQITERDCKHILIILIVGSLLDTAYSIGVYFLPSGLGNMVQLNADADNYYSWHQTLAKFPGLLICLAFARYKASELISLDRLWVFFSLVLCVVLIAMSGKRVAIAAVPLFAITASMLRREWGFLVLWLVGATIASGIIILGHGDLFHFPLTVQRTFSVLPAKWDPEFQGMEGGQDEFRKELRRQAMKKIEQDPWVGSGYAVNLSLAQALSTQYAVRGGDVELQVAPYAMGSAWHNTWLGYAADFGIPLSMIAALIYLTVIRRGYKLIRVFPTATFTGILSMYILLFTIRRLAFSHAAGHSAEEPFGYWWMFGLQIALSLRRPESPQQQQADVRSWSAGGGAQIPLPPRGRALPRPLSGSPVSARNVHS